MPRLRNLDLSPLLAYMNQEFQMKKLMEQQKLIGERQAQQSQDEFVRNLFVKGLEDPIKGAAYAQLGKMGGLDFGSLRPNSSQTLAPILSGIGSSKTVADIPSKEGAVADYIKRSGGMPIGGEDAANLFRQINSRKDELIAEELRKQNAEPITNKFIGPNGVEQTEYTTRGGVAGKSFQTERTPEQEATRAKNITLGSTLSPEVVNAEVNKAGRTAGAQTNAEEAARNSPTNVAGAAARAGAITQAQEDAKGPTDTEKAATQYYVRAIEAHNEMMKIEDQVSGFGTRIPQAVQSSLSKQYNTAKSNFVTSIIYLQSGKQINANEIEQYDKGWTKQVNDGPLEDKLHQKFRLDTLEGVKYLAGKGLPQYQKQGGKVPNITKTKPGSTLDQLRNRGGQ